EVKRRIFGGTLDFSLRRFSVSEQINIGSNSLSGSRRRVSAWRAMPLCGSLSRKFEVSKNVTRAHRRVTLKKEIIRRVSQESSPLPLGEGTGGEGAKHRRRKGKSELFL